MMILMLHILYQKHHLDLPKCLVENLMFFTSNISYILNAAANIFKGCGIFDLIFLSNMLLLLLTAANMFMSQIQAIFSTYYLCKKSFQKLNLHILIPKLHSLLSQEQTAKQLLQRSCRIF